MRRFLLPAAVLALLPAKAGGMSVRPLLIEPQHGIRAVSLTETPVQVRGTLGRPSAVRHPRSEILGRYLQYRYGRLVVDFSGTSRRAQVFSVRTTDRADRTRSDVGVGSTEAEVRRGLRGERCRTDFGRRHCYIGSFRPGRRVTDFFISRRGRVTRVLVGFVID